MPEPNERCAHATVFWYPAVNEDGWRCADCGEKLGFRPDLDRRDTVVKVDNILHDLHDHTLVYVSNSTHGEIVAAGVAGMCEESGCYDQRTIIRLIMAHPDMDAGSYWRDQSVAWLREHGATGDHASSLRGPGACVQCKTPLPAGGGAPRGPRARLCDTCAGEIKNYWVSGFTGTGKAVHS